MHKGIESAQYIKIYDFAFLDSDLNQKNCSIV